MSEQVEGQLTLFPEGSPASRSLLPGSREARKMTVISGRKWLGLSKNSGPLGLLEKTLLESLNWHSPIFYMNWKPVDIGQGHFLFQLALSEPDTEDTGVAIVGYSEHDGSSPAEIARGIKEAGRGKQKRKETSCEFTGAGKSGNGKSLADSHTEWKLQPPGCKQDIRNGIGLSSEDVANTNSAGLQAQGAEQQTARTSRTSENVQYANCARRKEQYASAKSDKERFIGWRCDERANRTSDGTAESIMDRMAHGFPNWMDGDLDFIINHYWDDEPGIPRVTTGINHRVDRLKCLGNAVVPQQFYPIFRAIIEIERSKEC